MNTWFKKTKKQYGPNSLISHTPYKTPKHHAAAKSRDKKNSNIMLRIPIGIIKSIHVRALEPVFG
jgi:hypothetical protein